MKKVRSRNKCWTIVGPAVLYAIGIFLLFGMVTVLIPNNWFSRMTPVNFLDYLFLIITSLLLGAYISFHKYQKQTKKTCTAAAYSGGIFGFLGFGCVLCNKILLLVMGVTGVLTYVEPIRPLLGFGGLGLMSYAVYDKGKGVLRK